MALSRSSVATAVKVLQQIDPTAKNNVPQKLPKKHAVTDQYQQHVILGLDRKEDGGWEQVFVTIEDMTAAQRQQWEELQGSIRNTSYMDEIGTVTQIGWY